MSSNPNGACVERRAAQRFEVHLPLTVHYEGRAVPGFIQDLSGRGIFFFAEAALPEGAIVELTFNMPSEITLAENMPVRCCGRVLRSSASPRGRASSGQALTNQSLANQRTGIAVRFDSYQYLPPDVPISPFVRVSAGGGSGVSGPIPR
jgi:PilZ domain-containing protein